MDSEAAHPIYSPTSVYERMLLWQIFTILCGFKVASHCHQSFYGLVISLITDVLNSLSWSFHISLPCSLGNQPEGLSQQAPCPSSSSWIQPVEDPEDRRRRKLRSIFPLPSLLGPSGAVHPWAQIYSCCHQLFPLPAFYSLLPLQALR